uniref:Uncharacterized protein n=1 Tax=Amphimedon queenslandica TaxID=400682 RepID=A0A1X7TX26_AMPQE
MDTTLGRNGPDIRLYFRATIGPLSPSPPSIPPPPPVDRGTPLDAGSPQVPEGSPLRSTTSGWTHAPLTGHPPLLAGGPPPVAGGHPPLAGGPPLMAGGSTAVTRGP